jgi:hypothetical protein
MTAKPLILSCLIASLPVLQPMLVAESLPPAPQKTNFSENPNLNFDFFGSYGADKIFLKIALDKNGYVRLPLTGDGLIDPANFRLYRVTAANPQNGKATSGELLQGLVEAACRVKSGSEPEMPADNICGERLNAQTQLSLIHLLLVSPLQTGERYALVIDSATVVEDGSTRTKDWIDFTIEDKQTIEKAPVLERQYVIVRSQLPLDAMSDVKLFLVVKDREGNESTQQIPLADVRYPSAFVAQQKEIENTPPGPARRAKIEDADPTLLHQLHLVPKRPFAPIEQELRVEGLRSLVDPAKPLGPAKGTIKLVPVKGEDDARYFTQIFWQVAEDEKPILSAVVKLDPLWSYLGRSWWIHPSLTADVGSDTSEAKNRIDLKAAELSRWRATDGDGLLSASKIGLSLGIETDKDLDKQNWMLTSYYQPFFKKWRNTREMRQGKASFLPFFGHSVEITAGSELGRSKYADDGVVMNKAKTSSVQVPDHDIARLHLHLNAFVEFGSFQIKLEGDARCLFEDEFTAVLDEDDDISLRTVDGFHRSITFGLGWIIDRQQHFVLSMEYLTGESPPKYEDVDTLKTTFTLKF